MIRSTLRRSSPRYGEHVIMALLVTAAVLSIVTTIGIVLALLRPAIEFFQEVSILEFLGGDRWAPLFKPASFGVQPLLVGTLMTTFWAVLVAIPCGLLVAIYLSEFARPRVRNVIKPVLEVLAGIPTVVFGYFALTAFTPLLRDIFTSDRVGVFNMLSAGIVVGIMLIPTVASISEDAMQAVPGSLRQGAFALGTNRTTVATKIVVPAAMSGIIASFVLAFSRAVGETMIVTIAAGLKPTITLNPFDQIETMTAFIAATAIGDTPTGSIEYKTIFAVGLTLAIITLALNLIAIRLVRRFREVYE